MKKFDCMKGKSSKIISNFGRGYPQTFDITITSQDGEEISGTYCERRYFWIFPQTPVIGKLEARMQFRRYWINGIYSVTITPECNVKVQIN